MHELFSCTGRVRTIIGRDARSPKYFTRSTHTPTDLCNGVYVCILYSDSKEVDGVAEQDQRVLVCGGVCRCVYLLCV